MNSFFESWDQYFMSMAFFVAMKSKDPSTKVGAVIVDDRHVIVSTGYNGFPRGVADSPERHERPGKYLMVCHAERNAVDVAGDRAIGAVIYTQWVPCAHCAQAIIQNGIREVVHFYPIESDMMADILGDRHDWRTSVRASMEMMSEAGVRLRRYDGEIVTGIVQVCNGKISTPQPS